ncbi:MAG TPA: UDP-N-acetylmuramoyl-tripeptide--D-alanyl-D-alanine ligase [Vicinamibacterales bacterium]|nr:UDP-N-acetylmuramoyl-tripeptide--D-alanyl-D-alanine ligase [Vicinamibacterales bacterium]
MPLTPGDIVAATGGRLEQGSAEQDIGGISIDSRTIGSGELFVAIRGDRFDGHDFVEAAMSRGALGAVVESGQAAAVRATAQGSRDLVIVSVGDTTRGLQDIARDVRRRAGTKVVAITGSAGKTTTKEVAAEFLAARFRVFRNRGNLNNHIGLPLSLLELRSRPEVAVVELGMNHAGEIRTLVGVAEPEVRVWTNVGDAHVGFFASSDAIADAKAEVLEHARSTDLLVANADDDRIVARTKRFAGRVTTFGIQRVADVQATAVEDRGLKGSHALVRTPAGEIRIETPLLGSGNLANVLAATAVALEFGVPLDAIAARAARLQPAHHRGELLRLPGGVTLIDDSYNSSPSALRRALQVMKVATGSARKIAVLGEMLELGAHAARLHQECGAAAADAGLDLLIAVGGPSAKVLADHACAGGMPGRAVFYATTSAEAADLAVQRVRPGDLVLVKGSRGIGTDVVVERLKAEYA